jgi:hypothetical protein
MHKFIRSLALLACIPAITAGNARAGAVDIRTDPISNTPAPAQQAGTSLIDPWGISSITTSPLWVAGEGPWTATIDEVAGGTISGAPMTAGFSIPAGACSFAHACGMSAGSSDSRLDGPEGSCAFAHSGGPVSSCSGVGSAAGPYDAGSLGILSADPRPISAAMGVIAVGSLAAAWGWKNRRRIAP